MNLYIGNLPTDITEQSLRDAFSEFGEVRSVKIIRDLETGEPKGFGFVEMGGKYEGYDAIDNLDATYFQGNIISVRTAHNSKESRRSGKPQKRFFRSSFQKPE